MLELEIPTYTRMHPVYIQPMYLMWVSTGDIISCVETRVLVFGCNTCACELTCNNSVGRVGSSCTFHNQTVENGTAKICHYCKRSTNPNQWKCNKKRHIMWPSKKGKFSNLSHQDTKESGHNTSFWLSISRIG